MARILARSGPYLTAMPLPDPVTTGTRLKRGAWLAVRMEIAHYDPVLKQDLRTPVADVQCWYEQGRFEVKRCVQGDRAGRHAQYHLDRLNPDEHPPLLADLKEV